MADQDRWRDDRDRYGRDDDDSHRQAGGARYRDQERDYGRTGNQGYGREQGGRYAGAGRGAGGAGRDFDHYGREGRGGGMREEYGGYDRGVGGRYGAGYGREPYVADDIGAGASGQSFVGNEGRGFGYGPDHRQGYGGRRAERGDYGPGLGGHRGEDERGWFERATDEVASWFGDEGAQSRREQDHRGKGPKGYTRSDERIKEDVSDRFYEDPELDASEIDIEVSGGEVTLAGTVESRWARRHAEDLAERVSGVRYVQNNLRVRRPGGSATPGGGQETGSGGVSGGGLSGSST